MRYFLIALTLLVAAGAARAQTCSAASGSQTAALIELYTSEGCSSCPAADRFLAGIPGSTYPLHQAVPLALHVPYWDYIGWTDGFAQAAFASRQSWLVGLNAHRTVYTPHFFVSGTEIQDWRGGLDAAIRQVNKQAAGANIEFGVSVIRQRVIGINASASSAQDGDRPQLFIAVTEGQLMSSVRAGENRGATLRHAHVVRALMGPWPLVDGRIATHQELALGAGWEMSRIGVTAFVQNPSTGKVLQAVATERCELARKNR